MKPSPTFIVLALTSLIGLSSACGSDDSSYIPPTTDQGVWTNPIPTINAVGPDQLMVGQELAINGTNFISSQYGQVTLRFLGTFIDDLGVSHLVDRIWIPSYINASNLSWKLFPDIVFHPEGNRLGIFNGRIIVTNEATDGSLKSSQEFPMSITIKPSLIPRLVQPVNAGCTQARTEHTLGEQEMQLAVEAVGFRSATSDAPLTFHWTFLAEQWEVDFDYSMISRTAIPEKGNFMLSDRITSGTTSTLRPDSDRHFLLKVADDLLGTTTLKKLKTKALVEGQTIRETTINVAVVDANQNNAYLSIPLNIHQVADMIYKANGRIAEYYEPVMVTDCMSGGKNGRDVTYSETTSESRTRSVGFNYNAQLGAQMGLPSNPFLFGVNFSAGFGTNINETLSTDKAESLRVSGNIIAGMWAVFYRQTTRVERIATLVGWTACGQTISLGDAVLTDWIFTPHLEMGNTCPPPTTFPPAQVFESYLE